VLRQGARGKGESIGLLGLGGGESRCLQGEAALTRRRWIQPLARFTAVPNFINNAGKISRFTHNSDGDGHGDDGGKPSIFVNFLL